MIDESLDTRIATKLKKRGRAAVSAAEKGWKHYTDPPLLRACALLEEPWVLVTLDDKLPYEHADVVAEVGATIATLDGEWEKISARAGWPVDQIAYEHETVHRWADIMTQ